MTKAMSSDCVCIENDATAAAVRTTTDCSSSSSSSLSSSSSSKLRRSVVFSTVTVREYPLTLGEINSSTRPGCAPLTLSWEYDQLPPQSLDGYETGRGGPDRHRRSSKEMRMSAGRRRAILALREDVSRRDVERAERDAAAAEERRRRRQRWAEDGGKTVLYRPTALSGASSSPLASSTAGGGGKANEAWDAWLDGPLKKTGSAAAVAMLKQQAAVSRVPLPAGGATAKGGRGAVTRGTRQRSFSSRAA